LSPPPTRATVTPAQRNSTRRHRGIAHRRHWVRDVTCNEDASRIRAGHGARNLAALRHHARNLLRQDRTRWRSVATARCLAALDHRYLPALLAEAHTK
jgi:hypothetical protein